MDLDTFREMFFGVLGGLGIFLLGMKNMSEGMQAVAGDKLRQMIGAVTNNRFIACTVGAVMTALIQSSSVTTVTVVGLVNASVMTINQAVGVILGANIGTTVTAWIIGLPIAKYGLPIIGFSCFIFLFSKRERLRYVSMACLGLGMVFYGLQLMKHGFAPLADMPEFKEWFARFEPTTYFGLLKCCLVGAILTSVVQSSSATIGITIGLASTGVINFPTAAALVLGENIGTTITAVLASLGASTNAKRAAYAHSLINLLGVAWITLIFVPYLHMIEWLLEPLGVDPYAMTLVDGKETFAQADIGIALTHTGFNVTNALFFLVLMPYLVKLLMWLAPGKKQKEKPHLAYLDVRMVDSPAIGIQQSKNEVLKMSRCVRDMLRDLRASLKSFQLESQEDEHIFHLEETLDIIQKEIVEFLSHLLAGNVPHYVMDEGRGQIRMADEYETISDYIQSLIKLKIRLLKGGLPMTDNGHRGLLELHDMIENYLESINEAVRKEDGDVLELARQEGASITRKFKRIRSEHLEKVESGEISPLKSLIYMDMLMAYRRIKDHALNIAEVLSGEK